MEVDMGKKGLPAALKNHKFTPPGTPGPNPPGTGGKKTGGPGKASGGKGRAGKK
jgi:hypothetical protein